MTRNIGIMAHIDAGKTTTTERILYYTGINHKIGETHDGALPWTGWSRSRSVVSPSPLLLPPATGATPRPSTIRSLQGTVIVSTSSTPPGHVDFTVEVERSLRVLDGSVTVLALRAVLSLSLRPFGVRLTSTMFRAWCTSTRWTSWVLTSTAAQMMKDRLHANGVAIQLPIGSEDTFRGIIDLIEYER